MKKHYIFAWMIISIVLMFSLTACGSTDETNDNANNQSEETTENVAEESGSKEPSIEDMYLETLAGNRTYIDEDNVETNVKEVEHYQRGQSHITYAIFDLDGDEENEMVADFSGELLILNYEDGQLYGIYAYCRWMKWITVDGYYVESDSAGSAWVKSCTISKNVINETYHAGEDWGKFKIDGQSTTEAEYRKVYNELIESKEKVEFIEFDEASIHNNQSTTNTTSGTSKNDESKVSVDGKYEYIFPMDGLEVEGSKVTLELANGKVTYHMEYFDDTMKGTYEVNGNNVVATYTEEDLFNQGADRMEHSTISEQETYEISGNNLVINKLGKTMTFKKK